MEVVIPAALATGGAIFGAHKAAGAQSEAARLTAQSQNDALAFAREQEEQRRREYEEQQARLDRYYQEQQARRAPFRAGALSVLAKYGMPAPPAPPAQRPPDWTPDQGPRRFRGMVDFSGLGLGRENPADVTPALPLGGYGGLV